MTDTPRAATPLVITVTDPLPRWRRLTAEALLWAEALIAAYILTVPATRVALAGACACGLAVVAVRVAMPRSVQLLFPPGSGDVLEPGRGDR